MTRSRSFWAALAALAAIVVMAVVPGSAAPNDAPAGAGPVLVPRCTDVGTYDGTSTSIVYPGASLCSSTTSSSSTTTAPATTSTTSTTQPPASSTTSSSTSPSTSSSTSTTIPASSTSTPSQSNAGCGLASAAFCDTFDAPHNGGTQTGDLDPVLWGVSRVGDHNSGGGVLNAITPSHNACVTGATPPPSDVKVCNGQTVESVNDGGGVSQLNTYPKQPFNFAGRTGTVVFDVSGDSGGTHAAWPEFAITDEPVPGVRRSISFQEPAHAVNEVGFALDGCTSNGDQNLTGVGVVFGSVNGEYFEQTGSRPACVTKGSSTAMNHIKVEVSATHIRVLGTDAGSSTFKVLADDDVSLAFTQGLVWLDDVHYNARKGVEDNGNAIGTQFDHSFAWDNLGFDGPKTYRDLGFDVPYANVCCKTSIHGDQEINEGYTVGGDQGPRTFTVTGVDWAQTPTKAKIVFNAYTENSGVSVQVSLNGHTLSVPRGFDGFGIRSIGIDLPASDAVKGTNTLKVQFVNGFGSVSNVSVIMVAAAPVP